MSGKTLLYLAIAVVVLTGLYFILASTSVPIAKDETVLDVDTSAITDLLIESELGAVHLQRTDNGWEITEPIQFPAGIGYVRQALARIANMDEESVVTNNPERHSEFGVDSTAILLTVIADGDTSSLLVGSSATGRAANYVRLPGEDPVLLVKGNVRSTLQRPVDNWRDRVIVHPTMRDLMRYTTSKIELYKPGDADWILTKPDTIYELGTNPQYARLFSRVPHLSAISFAKDEELAGIDFDRPDNWFEVETVDGKVIHVNFYEEPDGDRIFARLEGSPATYVVSPSIYKQIFEDLEGSLTKMTRIQAQKEKMSRSR